MSDLKIALKEKLGMDLDLALKELGFPQAAYERVARLSLVSSAETLDILDAAVGAEDRAAIGRAAHELKGVYANLRITPLAETGKRMDALARAGASIDEIRVQAGLLRTQVSILRDILQ